MGETLTDGVRGLVRRMRRSIGLAGLMVALVSLTAACFTDLGAFGHYAYATDIDDGGIVVGLSRIEGDAQFHAIRIDPNQSMARLPEPEGALSSGAAAVNTSGTVAGFIELATPTGVQGRAVTWSPTGVISDVTPQLPAFGSSVTTASVLAMNDAGVLAGTYSLRSPSDQRSTRGFVLDPRSAEVFTTDPQAQPGDVFVADLNDAGVAVGTVRHRPIKWTRDAQGRYVAVELPMGTGTFGKAAAINDQGAVVGAIDNRPVLWAPGATAPTFLPSPPIDDAHRMSLRDINEAGMIVGTYSHEGVDGSSWSHAMRYAAPERDPEDLGVVAEGGRYSEASAINARGETVGSSEVGFGPNGPIVHIIRWSPPDAS